MEPMTLRVVVTPDSEGFLDAQMLELDIAVRGKDENALLEQIHHALCAEYDLATHYGQMPFVSLAEKTPPEFTSGWSDDAASPMGSLNLREDVMRALALVLRAKTATFTIREYKKAA